MNNIDNQGNLLKSLMEMREVIIQDEENSLKEITEKAESIKAQALQIFGKENSDYSYLKENIDAIEKKFKNDTFKEATPKLIKDVDHIIKRLAIFFWNKNYNTDRSRYKFEDVKLEGTKKSRPYNWDQIEAKRAQKAEALAANDLEDDEQQVDLAKGVLKQTNQSEQKQKAERAKKVRFEENNTTDNNTPPKPAPTAFTPISDEGDDSVQMLQVELPMADESGINNPNGGDDEDERGSPDFT